jgi:CBS-domain-containing membrane protein
MPCNYQELEVKPLRVACTLCEPNYFPGGVVNLEDPGINAMTDLTTVAAITISPSCNLDEATDRMLKMKVKLLFVTDKKERIIGLITYTDLQGERPILFQQTNGVSRAEICVLDIMTSIDNIDVIELSAVEKAKVGDIAMTMKKLNRQHALVLEKTDNGDYRIRGILSTSHLSKLLGMNIDTTEVAQTFAEMERVLGCKT